MAVRAEDGFEFRQSGSRVQAVEHHLQSPNIWFCSFCAQQWVSLLPVPGYRPDRMYFLLLGSHSAAWLGKL